MEEERLKQHPDHELEGGASAAVCSSKTTSSRYCGASNFRWATKPTAASAATFSFFFILIFLGTIVSTRWTDIVSLLLLASRDRFRAATFSFFFILIFLGTIVSTRWTDISSFAGTSIGRTVSFFSRPPSYPHREPHLLNCTTTDMTLTCPANYYDIPTSSSPSTPETCPEYFRWIHEDLKPWKDVGITREMVEVSAKFAHFRLIIVNGTAYVKQYQRAYQTRDAFTLWGVLQLLKMYPGQLPDLDMTFQCHDRPSIEKKRYRAEEAPPLFHFCGSDSTYDIVFPDWSFWGWPEINIKPWELLRKDLNEGNKMVNWTDRKPYAYWKGNLFTGERKVMMECNSTKEWNAEIYQQDWVKEHQEGYKNSDMSKQCTHRYKIYMEGNAWSVSEKYILACDSMSLLINPDFYDFFTRSLMPMQHYWPINPKHICKSVKFAVDWGNNHTESAQEIGRTGSKFIQEQVKMEHVYDYMFHVLSGYGNLLRYRPTVPPGSVELCSENWVCTQNGLEKAYKIETTVSGTDNRGGPCSLPPPYDENEIKEIGDKKSKFLNLVRDAEIGWM